VAPAAAAIPPLTAPAADMVHAARDPHAGQPVLQRGPSIKDARLVVILVHGRGGSAEDILALSAELQTTDVAYLAPQAAGRTWYPYSFLAPLEQNEPGLTSALALLGELIDRLDADNVRAEHVGLLGFSQGACLSLEFAARHARRYAAIAGLSGGLIGPAGTPRDYAGSFAATPVFLGCSDIDPHIPVERVHETAAVYRQLGASVDERIYPRMGHTINTDELVALRALFTPRVAR
jgi:predicted esterase